MQCGACKRDKCNECINIALELLARPIICTCAKKGHDGEARDKQILDPETQVIHTPGLKIHPDGEVVVKHDGPSAIAGRFQCEERDSGGAQCSFVGAKGEAHDHYIEGH